MKPFSKVAVQGLPHKLEELGPSEFPVLPADRGYAKHTELVRWRLSGGIIELSHHSWLLDSGDYGAVSRDPW